jgi:hypothetical protein
MKDRLMEGVRRASHAEKERDYLEARAIALQERLRIVEEEASSMRTLLSEARSRRDGSFDHGRDVIRTQVTVPLVSHDTSSVATETHDQGQGPSHSATVLSPSGEMQRLRKVMADFRALDLQHPLITSPQKGQRSPEKVAVRTDKSTVEALSPAEQQNSSTASSRSGSDWAQLTRRLDQIGALLQNSSAPV